MCRLLTSSTRHRGNLNDPAEFHFKRQIPAARKFPCAARSREMRRGDRSFSGREWPETAGVGSCGKVCWTLWHTFFPGVYSEVPAVSEIASSPDFSKCDGLIPAIAQDAATGDVLMMAYMNAESYAETLRTGRAVYYSRSRKKLWRKGEESGNVQLVTSVFLDCDADTILLKVDQLGGAACHEGYKSCFFREVTASGLKVVGERVFDPAAVYGKKG